MVSCKSSACTLTSLMLDVGFVCYVSEYNACMLHSDYKQGSNCTSVVLCLFIWGQVGINELINIFMLTALQMSNYLFPFSAGSVWKEMES